MKYTLRTIGILAFLTAISAANLHAGVIRVDSFAKGLETAKTRNAALLVFVHGSDWSNWGERLHNQVFKSKAFEQSFLNETVILTDVDILQSPDEEQKKKNDERNKGWKGKGVRTYPAVCAYLPDGTLLGSRQGQQLPKDIAKAQAAIIDLVTQSHRYMTLKNEADKAKNSKNTKAELAALVRLGEIPLARPKELLDRIKELDPADASGYHAKLSFSHWNKLFRDATYRTKDGKGAEVEAELNEMLKSNVYTNEQKALIYVALGACHRQQEGHEKQAAEAFKKAMQLAPESFAGQVAQRIYDAWYKEKKK